MTSMGPNHRSLSHLSGQTDVISDELWRREEEDVGEYEYDKVLGHLEAVAAIMSDRRLSFLLSKDRSILSSCK